MSSETPSQQIPPGRKQARRTALVLGLIALAIFAAFIGSAVLGR